MSSPSYLHVDVPLKNTAEKCMGSRRSVTLTISYRLNYRLSITWMFHTVNNRVWYCLTVVHVACLCLACSCLFYLVNGFENPFTTILFMTSN